MPFCNYCGDPADTLDHVVPYSFLTNASRRGTAASVGETVPCCRDCNGILGSGVYPTMEARCRAIHNSLQRRHKKLLSAPRWSAEELSEVGPDLRTYLLGADAQRQAVEVRIATALRGTR